MTTSSAGVFYNALRRKVLVERERLNEQEINQLLASMNALADGPTAFDLADAIALERGWWSNPGRYVNTGSAWWPPVKVMLRRQAVNSQGYADGGTTYYGTGAPLFYAESEDGDSVPWQALRASDREDAKARLRHKYRGQFNLRFYR